MYIVMNHPSRLGVRPGPTTQQPDDVVDKLEEFFGLPS
jgi:hypothetical protein